MDPILGRYLPSGGSSDPSKLAGIGGVFNSFNLAMYSYGDLNPLRIVDPDGNEDIIAVNNSKATNDQLASVAMIYKDNTLAGAKLVMLKIWGALKNFFGSSVNEKDVKFFFGNPLKSFDKFSTASEDPEKFGTAKAGEMYTYKQKDMSWTTTSFAISSDLGEGIVPQDPNFNNGINPHTKKNYITETFMHPATGGPINDEYKNGSNACQVRYGFGQMFNYLQQSATGMQGRYMIMR